MRAEWDERMTALRTGLNFADEFSAAGDVWSEADADGRAVERDGEQHVARGATPRRRRSVR